MRDFEKHENHQALKPAFETTNMRYEVTVEFHKDFVRVNEDRIAVGIASKPEKGKANLELIKKLAKHFNVSSSHVRIISGFKSRRKIVEIREQCHAAI